MPSWSSGGCSFLPQQGLNPWGGYSSLGSASSASALSSPLAQLKEWCCRLRMKSWCEAEVEGGVWGRCMGVSLIPWAGTALPKPSFLPDPSGILMHCLSLQLHSSVRGRCCAGARAGFQANWILCLRGFPCRQATGISAVFLRNAGEQG